MLKNKLLSAMGGAPATNYIEDVFSTYLYTGNSSTQTITNGIDLAGKGGLTWLKSRDQAFGHCLFDTARGATIRLQSNNTDVETPVPNALTSFNSSGFSLGSNGTVNNGLTTFASWTFRKQPKFFDVVTYTGNGGVKTINHSLGSVPGCIIIKATTSSPGATDWAVWHRSIADGLLLNSTDRTSAIGEVFARSVTSTSFNVDRADTSRTNENGVSFVAYVFAHDAGGFGLSGEDNVVSCGSYIGGADVTVNLGYEPQWVLTKAANTVQNWTIHDTMRGYTVNPTGQATLHPNNSDAEDFGIDAALTSTGFRSINSSTGYTYIYIAIRRGPMKVPTSGTSVFSQTLTSSNANPLTITTNFPVDMTINRYTGESSNCVFDRLRGANASASGPATYLKTEATSAEATAGTAGDNMQSNTTLIDRSFLAGTSDPKIYYSFRRAPSFFDEVCYTGTGVARTIAHNLTVAPELILYKSRSIAYSWLVQSKYLSSEVNNFLSLNGTGGQGTIADVWKTPTATTIGMNQNFGEINESGATYVAYLFATCPGVSKVGSYTGTGTTQAINCGFTAGARFVLIKRTDSTGDWYYWDSARGIVAGDDPYLLLNSAAAEVTNTDYIDTSAAGFEITSTAPAAINASGGSFIFLAVA